MIMAALAMAGNATKPKTTEKPTLDTLQPDNSVKEGQESACRRKTSKYLLQINRSLKMTKKYRNFQLKGRPQRLAGRYTDVNLLPGKKVHKHKEEDEEEDDDDDDDDDYLFVVTTLRKVSADVIPSKRLKSSSGRGNAKKSVDVDESDEDDVKETKSHSKEVGRSSGVTEKE